MIREITRQVIELIAAAMPTPDEGEIPVGVYDNDEVPNMPSLPYVVVYSWRRGAGGSDARRLSDTLSSKAWRISTMVVGQTADEARFVEERTELALEGTRIAVSGIETTPFHFETSRGVTPDPGVEQLYTGTSNWTCVSTQPA